MEEGGYNPLRTYSKEELACLLHTGRSKIDQLERFGVLTGIKIGKATIFSSEEILSFLQEAKGADLSNVVAIKEFVERRNKA